ncbi:MAG: hypothetical protein ACRDP6_47260 [Actinoallomurus sp.]
MTGDAKGVLIFLVLISAAWFTNYLLREWPAAKRTLFDAHVDDAIRLTDSYRMHPAVKEKTIRRAGEDVEDALREFGQTAEGRAYADEVMAELRRRRHQ